MNGERKRKSDPAAHTKDGKGDGKLSGQEEVLDGPARSADGVEPPELTLLKHRIAMTEDAYRKHRIRHGVGRLVEDMSRDRAAETNGASPTGDGPEEDPDGSDCDTEDDSSEMNLGEASSDDKGQTLTDVVTQPLQRATGVIGGQTRRSPGNAAAHRFLKFWQRPLLKYVHAELSGEVCALAEYYRAHWSGLFVPCGDQLEEIVANGYSEPWVGRLDRGKPSIVMLVARTREPYCAPDLERHNDPNYLPVNPETRSEQAVPIIFGGELLGVLNQESHIPGQFCPATTKSLEQDAFRLVPHLLARDAHRGERGDGSPCLWNPHRHGWDINRFLQLLTTDLREALGPAFHVTAWYADPFYHKVFALASTGYSGAFLRTRMHPMDSSFCGEMALRPDGTVADCSAGDPRLVRSDVDRAMGLYRTRAVTVRSCLGPRETWQPGFVLSFYGFVEKEWPTMLTEEDLRKVAELIRPQIEGFRILRPAQAAAQMELTLRACPDTEESLTKAAGVIAQVLEADAVTILARPRTAVKGEGTGATDARDSDKLYVAAATSPLEYVPRRGESEPLLPPWGRARVDSGYIVGDGSLTGTLAANPGQQVRLNSPQSGDEAAAGPWLDQPTPKLREWLPPAVSTFRRCLVHSVVNSHGKRSLGVVRVIRSSEGRPFTNCDQEVLAAMSQACEDEFRSWRDWFDHTAQGPGYGGSLGRLAQPIPRLSNRPTREVIREVLVDVWNLVRERLGDCVLQTAVLVEQVGHLDEPMGVFAYHSELSTVPPVSPEFSPTGPRIPGIGWDDLLGRPGPVTFELGSPDDGEPVSIRAGARVPFWAWCGRHMQRGVLLVDLDRSRDFRAVVDDLSVAARKVAAILTLSGSTVARSRVITTPDARAFLSRVRELLKVSSIILRLNAPAAAPRTWAKGKPLPRHVLADPDTHGSNGDKSFWTVPTDIALCDEAPYVDPDAQRWGIYEASYGSDALLRVPLRLGAASVGAIVAAWPSEGGSDPGLDTTTRALRIRDLLALWSVWVWAPREDHPIDYELRVGDGPEGVTTWVATPRLGSVAARPSRSRTYTAI